MSSKHSPPGEIGPLLRTTPFDQITDGIATRVLTPRQRQELESLSTLVTINARGTVYRAGTHAGAVYICREGALKSFRELPSGKRRIMAFLFSRDLFGLSERGRYLNTVQALTRAVCYRIPIEPLQAVLRKDAELEFQFLCKLVHELREVQYHTVMVGRRSAAGRVAMFLTLLEKNLASDGTKRTTIPLPMSRSDIAEYLGLSLEAVSRACTQLTKDKLIAFDSSRFVRVLDRARLDKLVADI
jgi:CRP/FNR family transcriptional regulator